MARVMYCTMDPEELASVERIASDNGIDLYPYLLEVLDRQHCRILLEEAQEKGADAILCRGQILSILRGEDPGIPLVPNYFAGNETMSILNHIRQDYGQEMPAGRRLRVCLLSHHPLYINEKLYSEVFDMDVHNVIVKQDRVNRPEEYLREIRAEGYDCLVCGRGLKQAAQAIGWRVYSELGRMAEDSIYEALRTTGIVAASEAELKRSMDNLRIMMDNAFEAIILLDPQGRIRFLNRRTQIRLKLAERSYAGEYIWTVIPEIGEELVRPVLESGTNVYGSVVELEDYAAVVNISAVTTSRQVSGAVVQFTELDKLERMSNAVRKEVYVRGHIAKYHFEDIVGKSLPIEEAKKFAAQFARYNANVMILGETGIGKEVFAQSIHNASLRRDKPFVAVNCGALPLNLLESELFGYVDGAFTGASRKGKKGLLEIANGGTIFLDEISEMDLSGQVQLLRVLEERVMRKIGDDKVTPVDVRVIAASNRNLRSCVEEGKFREDLYYRLNVLTLNIPPLRERGGDILLLAEKFFDTFGRKYRKVVSLTAGAREVIGSYAWPGNVRQLRNFCERLVIVADQAELDADFTARQMKESFMLREDELRGGSGGAEEREKDARLAPEQAGDWTPGSGELAALTEPERIRAALAAMHGSRKLAGELLGMSKATLWRKMKKYGLGKNGEAEDDVDKEA